MQPRPVRGRRASRDRWLVSYADLITLLFGFFTVMYATSTVDSAKLTSVANGLQRAFDDGSQQRPVDGVLPGGRGVLPYRGRVEQRHHAETEARLRRELLNDEREGRVELSNDPRGLVISIPEAGSFGVGQADLSEPAEAVLVRLAGALASVPESVRVEGHTDDTPIHTPRFDSNWELSTARATRVVQFLIARGGLTPERLSAAGFSQFHPRAENDTETGRARNRRVDVIVLTGDPGARDAHIEASPR